MPIRVKRPLRIDGNTVYVPLTRGHEAVVDLADLHIVQGFNWHAYEDKRRNGTVRSVYAMRKSETKGEPHLRLHRLIALAPDGMYVDHIDGNGLNNRRSNLRVCTFSQNIHNYRKPFTNTSGVKGVSWCPDQRKWRAQIKVNGRKRHIGRFSTIEEAAQAYAKASREVHGQFGRSS